MGIRLKQKFGVYWINKRFFSRHDHHLIVVIVLSSFRFLLPLLLSFVSFSSSSSSSSSPSSSSSSLSSSSYHLTPLHARETLGNNFSQPRQGTWSFFAKTKAKTGVRRSGQRRPSSAARRRGRREEDGWKVRRRSEGEDATGGFLPRSISSPASNRYVRPSSFLSTQASLLVFFPVQRPFLPPRCSYRLSPSSLPRAHLSSSLFFFPLCTELSVLAREQPRTETIGGAILPRRLRRHSFLHFDTSRTVILMHFAIDRGSLM